jgi:tetratricopeptide (TPR) repeat protein
MNGSAARCLTLTILLLAGSTGWSAEDDYRSGIDAFKQGRYGDALEYFTRAYDAGGRDPTLFYNLGSAQFKLGDYSAAYGSFEQIAEDPGWGPLARYNLGLIDERRGEHARAQQHFRAAYAAARSDKLKQLAAGKIDTSGVAKPADDAWFGIVSLAGGFDDNVVLLNDQSLVSVSNKEDYFADALASVSGFVHGDVERGWRADVSAYYRAYRDQTDYDYGTAAAALTYNTMTASAQWQFGGRLYAQFVGGEAYTTALSMRAQLLRPVGAYSLRIRNDAAYYEGASDYDYLTGWQDRLGVQISRRFGRNGFRLGYELELNDRDDLTTGIEFFSYSPTWNRFYGDATRYLSDAFDVQVRAEYQFSDYRDEDVQINPDDTVTVAARDDDRIVASLRLTYHPSQSWGVFSEYSYTDNSSNFSEYEYDDNQIMIGIERPF